MGTSGAAYAPPRISTCNNRRDCVAVTPAISSVIELGEDVTFSDPVGWPRSAARAAPGPDDDTGLPPLPTLEPLPRLKPLDPMPQLPWDDDPPAPTRPAAPPPPANHPAAEPIRRPPAIEPAGGYPTSVTLPVDAASPGAAGHGAANPDSAGHGAPSPGASAEPAIVAGPSPAALEPGILAEALPFADAQPFADPQSFVDAPGFEAPGFEAPAFEGSTATAVSTAERGLPRGEAAPVEQRTDTGTTATQQFFAATPVVADAAAPSAGTSPAPSAGRHATVQAARQDEALPHAPSRRVLVVGGAEPLGGMVAERLIAAGHRIAVNGVTIPAELPPSVEVDGEAYRTFEPVPLAGDRSDSEEIVHTVARAEVALGGLDALVMLPGPHHPGVGLDADAGTWSDEWSLALTTEVLAAACASHIAARSFLARRKAGRIVLVTDGRDGVRTGAMPASATRAALSRLGADLARELGPHGIGVSVVATGTGGTQDFAMTQVADVVEALLSTPVLSGVHSQIG